MKIANTYGFAEIIKITVTHFKSIATPGLVPILAAWVTVFSPQKAMADTGDPNSVEQCVLASDNPAIDKSEAFHKAQMQLAQQISTEVETLSGSVDGKNGTGTTSSFSEQGAGYAKQTVRGAKIQRQWYDFLDGKKLLCVQVGTAAPEPKPHAPVSGGGLRVALVIGNYKYSELGTLGNPGRDAEAVAERLAQAGFKLLRPVRASQDVQANLSLEEMLKAGAALKAAAQKAEIALLFYAGHGLQLGGLPYLVPVSAQLADVQNPASLEGQEALGRRMVKLDDLIEGLDERAQLAVAVFDACREIPKTRSLFAGSTDVVFRGLSRPQSSGKRRLLAFSAGFGELAVDGKDHSPYTQAFMDEFDAGANEEMTDFFRRVQSRVIDQTGQTPELSIQGNVPPDTFFMLPAAGAGR